MGNEVLKYPLRRVPLLSVLTSSLGLSFLIQKMRLVSGQRWQRSFPSGANSNPWRWLRTGLGNLRLQLDWNHNMLSPSVTNSLRPHSPGKDTGMVCNTHLQGIFLTQESIQHASPTSSLAGGFFTTSATWCHNK